MADRKRQSVFGSFKDKLSRKSSINTSAARNEPGNLFVGPSSSSPRSPLSAPKNPSKPTSPPTRRPDRAGFNAFTVPSNEPPPAYTPSPITPVLNTSLITDARPSTSHSISSRASRVIAPSTAEDPYAFLSSFDTVFLIDDSGSMAGSRWRECSQALEATASICTAHDEDGIDIYFINAPDQPVFKNVKEASTVHEIFSTVRPYGQTWTGKRLKTITREYINKLKQAQKTHGDVDSVKPLNIIVITDGEPTDMPEEVIMNAARALDEMEDIDAWQLGIQFVQVGNDPEARRYLETLDDGLSQRSKETYGTLCRDIVDTVPFKSGRSFNADMILKVVLGAVNKRLDRVQN